MKKWLMMGMGLVSYQWGFSQGQPDVVVGVPQINTLAGSENVNKIALFVQGYAKVTQGGKTYYINTRGEKAFDALDVYSSVILGNPDDIEAFEAEMRKGEVPPTKVIRFVNDGKWGVMVPDGHVIVPANYDDVDIENPFYWKLRQGKQVSLYLKDGATLPFFDDIGYLDGNYFDVKQSGKWGIYSLKDEQLVIPAQYDGFDYCGGCGSKSDYVYAAKNGKWGIMDWTGKELLPFAYEHTHWGMRSDNWVASFAKGGKQLIVHVPTGKEFVVEDGYPKIVSGMLIFKEASGLGVYGQNGALVVPAQYDQIEAPNENSYLGYYGDYLLVQKAGRTGVIDQKGTVILPVQYDQVTVYDDYFVAKDGNQTMLFDKEHQTLLQLEQADITHVNYYFYSGGSGGLHVFKVKQKAYYGLYFADSNTYYAPEFYGIRTEETSGSDQSNLIVGEKQGILTVFDLEGKVLLPARYDKYSVVNDWPSSLLQVWNGDKTGVYDTRTQREVIPVEYDSYLEPIGKNEQLVICHKQIGERLNYELWDLSGNRLLEEQFISKDDIDGTFYLFQHANAKQYTLFNTETKEQQVLAFAHAWKTGSAKLILVSNDGKTGHLYNIYQKKTRKESYDVMMFSGDLDNAQATVDPRLYPYRDGYARIERNRKFGFLDEDGKPIVPAKYDQVSDFQPNGVAMVATGDASDAYGSGLLKAGFIDRKGRMIIPMDYVQAADYLAYDEQFVGGSIVLAKYDTASRQLRFGLADSTGRILLPVVYSSLNTLNDKGGVILQKDNVYGLANLQGKLLVAVEYDDIGIPRQGFVSPFVPAQLFPIPVKKAGKWFYIDEKGNRLPIEADYLDN